MDDPENGALQFEEMLNESIDCNESESIDELQSFNEVMNEHLSGHSSGHVLSGNSSGHVLSGNSSMHLLMNVPTPEIIKSPTTTYLSEENESLKIHIISHISEDRLLHTSTHHENILEPVKQIDIHEIISDQDNYLLQKCSDCNYITTTPEQLKLHSSEHLTENHVQEEDNLNHLDKTNECVLSSKTTEPQREKSLKQDFSIITKNNKEFSFKCIHCNYTTHKKTNIRPHIRSHSKKILACSHCSYKTNTKSCFNKHSLIHSDDKPIKCSLCKFQCKHPNYLASHVRNHHNNFVVYKCKECTFETSSQRSYKGHLITHLDPKKVHKCPFCEYCSTQKGNVKIHIKTRHKTAEYEMKNESKFKNIDLLPVIVGWID